MKKIQIKRAYEPIDPKKDGYLVLVDRLWPRGIKKTRLPIDEWAKEISPSTELRREFGHDPGRWPEFKRNYARELRSQEAKEKLRSLAKRARKGAVTLVYAAKDEEHNNAVVLKELIEKSA